MRALAVAVLMGVALAGPANAGPWSDPDSKLAFVAPDGWRITPIPQEGLTYVLADSQGHECHFLAMPRPDTESIGADRIRTAGQAPIAPEAWAGIPPGLPAVFGGAATVASSSVDTERFWPEQRADFNAEGGRVVHAAIQFRPGQELWSFCLSRTGADDVGTYDAILNSVSTTRDEELSEEVRNAELAQIASRRRIVDSVQDVARRSQEVQNGMNHPGNASYPQ